MSRIKYSIKIKSYRCNYTAWEYPMNIWLVVSYSITIFIRVLNYVGYWLSVSSRSSDVRDFSNAQDQPKINFNWKNAKLLKFISFFSVIILFPLFVVWTIIGTFWFSVSFHETPYCFSNYQEYSFIFLNWMF